MIGAHKTYYSETKNEKFDLHIASSFIKKEENNTVGRISKERKKKFLDLFERIIQLVQMNYSMENNLFVLKLQIKIISKNYARSFLDGSKLK